jgi:hypothetical protein
MRAGSKGNLYFRCQQHLDCIHFLFHLDYSSVPVTASDSLVVFGAVPPRVVAIAIVYDHFDLNYCHSHIDRHTHIDHCRTHHVFDNRNFRASNNRMKTSTRP